MGGLLTAGLVITKSLGELFPEARKGRQRGYPKTNDFLSISLQRTILSLPYGSDDGVVS